MGAQMEMLKGTESGFGSVLAQMKTLYDELPADVKSNYPTELTLQADADFKEKRVKGLAGEPLKMKKGALLRAYKVAEENGLYVTPKKAKDAPFIIAIVKERCPEWGTVLSAGLVETNYANWKVNHNSLGTILNRESKGWVICEDQGYKTVHFLAVVEKYASGGQFNQTKLGADLPYWNSKVELVK